MSAIDYVTSILVNETCELLQDIVDKIIPPIYREQSSNMIHSTKYFLKNQCASHSLCHNDDVCYHGTTYGLSKNAEAKMNTQCSECKFPFYACDQLKKILPTTKYYVLRCFTIY